MPANLDEIKDWDVLKSFSLNFTILVYNLLFDFLSCGSIAIDKDYHLYFVIINNGIIQGFVLSPNLFLPFINNGLYVVLLPIPPHTDDPPFITLSI